MQFNYTEETFDNNVQLIKKRSAIQFEVFTPYGTVLGKKKLACDSFKLHYVESGRAFVHTTHKEFDVESGELLYKGNTKHYGPFGEDATIEFERMFERIKQNLNLVEV